MMFQLSLHSSLVGVVLALLLAVSLGKKIEEVTAENCEVCVSFMSRFLETIDDPTGSDVDKIEDAIRRMCKTTKKDDNRFCYYIGGLEESATGMLGVISKPITWGVPAEKICLKMYRKDAQICDLKYDKVIDLSKVDFKKLKVKDLKQILSDWDESCRGCTEKSDFITRIDELLPKYDPKAHEKRKTEL